MKVSYVIYDETDEIINSGTCDVVQAPILLTTELVKGNTVVMEAIDELDEGDVSYVQKGVSHATN